MNLLNLLAGIIDVLAGVSLIALSLPLLRDKAQSNSFYGFRFGRAFTSAEHWRQINRYGARWTILWSSLLVLIGIVAFFIPFGDNTTLAFLWIVIPVLLLSTIPIIQTASYAKHIAG
ncbi:SdpI family protein [Thermogemmatispora sp.]|uniref:SdpI family protein n=1 Tax=Thermogemmatispora sp. TaxID=1968838 RepID=UPI001E1A231D|nr:SdpI family protein [Thermogemmatispora sp.]MBX5450957.1 SdpI family protein [Thermogemmatispora sp.]